MTKSKAPKRGITPIVSIIILLLITVALAGAAYSYIMMHWSSVTGKSVLILNSYCTGGNTANVIVQNTGTQTLPLHEIEILDAATGQPAVNGPPLPMDHPLFGLANWTTTNGKTRITELEPGEKGKFDATCTGYCTYRFIQTGSIGFSTQTVSVPC